MERSPVPTGHPFSQRFFAQGMSTDRLAQLRGMLAEEPNDAFLRYAIALELKRAGKMEEAADDLERLLKAEPKYIACYYQLALILIDLGRTQEAMHVCEAGSLQCITTGDRKARAELLELRNAIAGDE
jgi:tetratricopeptide (TPR) repeat protein